MMLNRFVPAIVAVVAITLSAPAAWAHAHLVSATPAANATVAAPAQITLTFSEAMARAFSTFDVVNTAGATVAVRTTISDDGKSIVGVPAQPFVVGAYTVNWRIASVDGHRMTGSFAFTVR